MNQKVLKTLEYNKIITQLTGYAASTPGKLLCQNLLPMSDYHEIVPGPDGNQRCPHPCPHEG